jgi:hypothetical protein
MLTGESTLRDLREPENTWYIIANDSRKRSIQDGSGLMKKY